MNSIELYMKEIESRVMAVGLRSGVYNSRSWIPVKMQKMHWTDFGKIVSVTTFDVPEIFALDYYGLAKRSVGFMKTVEEYRQKGIEIRSMLVPTAYFAGIKVEYLSEIAPDLVDFFPEFKKYIVEQRNFQNEK